MRKRFGAEETYAGNVGVGGRDKRIGYLAIDGIVLEGANGFLNIGVRGFSAEKAEDFTTLGSIRCFCSMRSLICIPDDRGEKS